LDVYQLGALLHDLIMREPLFQSEYIKSYQNRYRFAWIVAMNEPEVRAQDVDHDLVFLAQRALDKDWKNRSKLKLEDFLADASTQRTHSLQILGLGRGDLSDSSDSDGVSARRQRLRDVARAVEEAMLAHLRKQGVTATHNIEAGGDDDTRRIRFAWAQPADPSAPEAEPNGIEFRLELRATGRSARPSLGGTARLHAVVAGTERDSEIEIPAVRDDEDGLTRLIESAVAALEQLAVNIVSAR
jgi:hypothetical protein